MQLRAERSGEAAHIVEQTTSARCTRRVAEARQLGGTVSSQMLYFQVPMSSEIFQYAHKYLTVGKLKPKYFNYIDMQKPLGEIVQYCQSTVCI